MANKTICNICGLKFKNPDGEARNCPRCDADVRNANNEILLISERGGLICAGEVKGNFSGTLMLTDKRILLIHDSAAYYAFGFLFGALGSLIAMGFSGSSSKKPAIVVHRAEITSMEDTKRGLGRLLDLTTRDGNVYRLSLAKKRLADWRAHLETPMG